MIYLALLFLQRKTFGQKKILVTDLGKNTSKGTPHSYQIV